MTTITAPDAKNMTGELKSHYGPVELLFVDGVATFDGDLPDSIRAYMLGAGYGIDGAPKTPDAPAAQLDSRDVGHEQVGTALRDAAVDPESSDFLAPVNAGEGDPHGPTVVAPGVHAEGERVVAAGPVYSDPDAQQANEKRLAEKLLIDGEQVTPPVEAADFLEQGGPLGLSDPGSVEAGQTTGDAADPGTVDEPKGNASRSDWARYAKSQGASDDDLLDPDGAPKSRDDLRAAYGS